MKRHTICFDALCSGYSPVIDGEGLPVEFMSEEDALREINDDPEFYDDCFTCPMDDIRHKSIFMGEDA